MLYILPPPRTPNPPSPWVSILCNNTNSVDKNSASWGDSEKKPPFRVRPKKLDDGTTAQDDMDTNRHPKSLSECYFAGKGTALVLPVAEAQKSNRRTDAHGSNIRKHLQSIVDLLRPEETLKMAVKLESVHPNRIRYLVIVSRGGERGEESCLLGIDCNEKTTVGLVLRVMADTRISLDGDGGFSVSVCGRHHIFKPVSVQAMWSALQTLHKVSSKARDQNYFQGGLSHSWVSYYEDRIESDRSCLNEWHAMDNLESKRPPSPDSIRNKPRERDETEKVIRATLKEIMMSVDLDEVTSKYIRGRLEEDLDMDLGEYKSFIDQEMLTILGQMDAPTEIFDHVYLGSEWNASNYEELQRNGVGHILNVTREIDNFFPGTFDYLNVRVYDDEKTNLLKHWDDTFKYITKARKSGSKVLVHCKMGVSRSASVVIAYAMKAYNWDFKTAMHHVKEKRTCVKPNTAFLSQLETYQGILDAMKNKEKLQRSKSETNLKSPVDSKRQKILANSEPTPVVQASLRKNHDLQTTYSGQDLRCFGARPKSWSPDIRNEIDKSPVFLSLEDLSQKSVSRESVSNVKKQSQRHVLMPCDNGESYSVSANQILHLPAQENRVKSRVNELESNRTACTRNTTTWDLGENVQESFLRDPFSNQLDRVFDREERKQQRHSVAIPFQISECPPSRQNSWSSYDSAVVLNSQNDNNTLSRQSSWGSGDTRALPSRNSSWGSYDIKPTRNSLNDCDKSQKDDVTFYSGTVKKTKQKLGDAKNMTKSSSSETLYDLNVKPPAEAVNRHLIETLVTSPSAVSPTIKIPSVIKSRGLSASAPETSGMLELLIPLRKLSKSSTNINVKEPEKVSMVQSLRKEFEAKTETKNSAAQNSQQAQRTDELNFKNLLGFFERNPVNKRPYGAKSRFSSIEVSKKEQEFKRPPISPANKNTPTPYFNVAATVIAKAVKKQQQYGRNHPLALLTMKSRQNNTLYNTM